MLITHSHKDHFVPLLAILRQPPYAHNFKYDELRFYGPENLEQIYDRTVTAYSNERGPEHVAFSVMEDRQLERLGAYTVTALRAQHAPALKSLNYIIEDGKKALLYLLDSGYPTEDTLNCLETCGKRFDCVVMDSTMGFDAYEYHMNFAENKKLKQELIKRGAVHENTKFVISHITHNHCPSHEEIEKEFDGSGITVAYDGIELEF